MSEDQTIPIERLNKEIAKRRDAEARTAELSSALDQLKAQAATLEAKAAQGDENFRQLQALQSQQDKTRQRHESVVSLLEHGVRDSSVREFVLHGFEKQASGEGARDWDTWWSEQRESPSAVLRPFLSGSVEPVSAPVATAETVPATTEATPSIEAVPTPRANNGAVPSPTPGRYEAGDFARMASTNPRQFIERLRAGEFNN